MSWSFQTQLANEPELVNEPEELANEPDLANEPELADERELVSEPETIIYISKIYLTTILFQIDGICSVCSDF